VEIALGFLIAVAIALTGVGAGSMTTPILMLAFGVPPVIAVGSSLAFGFVVKVVSTPVYLFRGQIHYRTLGLLVLGGVPGVVLGSFILGSLNRTPTHERLLYGSIGVIIAGTALLHLWRMATPRPSGGAHDRSRLLPWLALPIGAEVGFSSAGAGALGSLLMLTLTPLAAAEIVGTDLAFGLALSLVGSGFQLSSGNYNGLLLAKLIAGGVAGAIAGSLLAGRVAQRPLRVALLIALVLLGGQLCWRAVSPPVVRPASHAPLSAASIAAR
jgi:uncharacterized membrane protein YfcA